MPVEFTVATSHDHVLGSLTPRSVVVLVLRMTFDPPSITPIKHHMTVIMTVSCDMHYCAYMVQYELVIILVYDVFAVYQRGG